MAGRKSGHFIEEEQFGPAVWCHNRSLPPVKFKPAYNPGLMLKRFNDLFLQMDYTAVSHPRSACAGCYQISFRVHAVLKHVLKIAAARQKEKGRRFTPASSDGYRELIKIFRLQLLSAGHS